MQHAPRAMWNGCAVQHEGAEGQAMCPHGQAACSSSNVNSRSAEPARSWTLGFKGAACSSNVNSRPAEPARIAFVDSGFEGVACGMREPWCKGGLRGPHEHRQRAW